MAPPPNFPSILPPTDALPSLFLSRLTSDWAANPEPAPVPPSPSVDLFMVLFVSIFLFLTAAILRLVPWASPLSPRPRWSARHAMSRAGEAETLRRYSAIAYGTLGAASDAHQQSDARGGPSYETLLEIGDRIGPAKPGLTDEQIQILPTYKCTEEPGDDEHSRRGHNCAICRDVYHTGDAVSILPCGDEYHTECITPWLRQQASCPLCRCRFA